MFRQQEGNKKKKKDKWVSTTEPHKPDKRAPATSIFRQVLEPHSVVDN